MKNIFGSGAYNTSSVMGVRPVVCLNEDVKAELKIVNTSGDNVGNEVNNEVVEEIENISENESENSYRVWELSK